MKKFSSYIKLDQNFNQKKSQFQNSEQSKQMQSNLSDSLNYNKSDEKWNHKKKLEKFNSVHFFHLVFF